MNDFLERAFEPHLPPLTDLIEAPPSGAVCAMKGRLLQGAGCSLRPIPGQMIEGIPLDMVMLRWTPPYWHSLCQALCLTAGYEGEVVYDGSG